MLIPDLPRIVAAVAALLAFSAAADGLELRELDRITAPGLGTDIAYDAASGQVFATTAAGTLRVVTLADGRLRPGSELTFESRRGSVVGVAAHGGVVAVAVTPPMAEPTVPGRLLLLDAATFDVRAELAVDPSPARPTFTPDGSHLLLLHRGAGARGPSIGVVDLTHGAEHAVVRRAGFEGFAGRDEGLRRAGVLLGDGEAAALVPEDVAVAADGHSAWIVLGSNNAVAVLDVTVARVRALVPFGQRDSGPGPAVPYQPAALATVERDGATWLLTANRDGLREQAELAAFEADGATAAAPAGHRGAGSLAVWSPALALAYDSGTAGRDGDVDALPERMVTGRVGSEPYAFVSVRGGGVRAYAVARPQVLRLAASAGAGGGELLFVPAPAGAGDDPLLLAAGRQGIVLYRVVGSAATKQAREVSPAGLAMRAMAPTRP